MAETEEEKQQQKLLKALDKKNGPTVQSKELQKIIIYMASARVYESGISLSESDREKALIQEYRILVKIFFGRIGEIENRSPMKEHLKEFFEEKFFTEEFHPRDYTEEQLLRVSGSYPKKVEYLTGATLKRRSEDIRREVN
jgi:hypothetical protein